VTAKLAKLKVTAGWAAVVLLPVLHHNRLPAGTHRLTLLLLLLLLLLLFGIYSSAIEFL
jgi:hypothetical protein